MKKSNDSQQRGSKLRRIYSSVIARVGAVRLSLGQAAVGGALLLVIGISIGGTTNAWDTSLKTLGLKPDVPALDLSSLQQTYEQLAATYDGEVDRQKLLDGAQHGLVSALGDPYTVYFNQQEATEFSSDLSGSFSGIGAALAIKNSVVTVSSTLDGSPAEAAGVRANDQIVAVDDASTEGWSLDEAVSKIRGESGSTVTLGIVRGGERIEISVVRADLTNPSVTSEVRDGIGILSISRFGDDTARLARDAAESFKSQNVRGVVLDLRGNGGGYVDAAQEIAGIWLNDKVVVSERSGGATVASLKTGRSPILEGVATIVLIDGGSASASEIVAGALRDHNAATLYGQTSFGKGSVQSVYGLLDGAELKVTIARWYTPNGKNIDNTGIAPDREVAPTEAQIEAGEDPALTAALTKLAE